MIVIVVICRMNKIGHTYITINLLASKAGHACRKQFGGPHLVTVHQRQACVEKGLTHTDYLLA